MSLLWDEVTYGTIVRVRSVEDMIKEFGRDERGNPEVDVGWDHEMAGVCGLTCRVVARMRRRNFVQLDLEPEDASDHRWSLVQPLLPGDVGSPRTALDVMGMFTWSTHLVELVPAVAVAASSVSDLELLGGPSAEASLAIHPYLLR